MGDTAVSGADTPRYNPLIPCVRKVLESMPNTEALALAALPVCMRTFTKSRGCPTRTQHAPPTPPEMKDLSPDDDDSSFGEAGCVGFVSSFMVGVISEEDVVDDMILYYGDGWDREN